MREQEAQVLVAAGGRPAARVAARLLALQARSILGAAETLLREADDTEALLVAAEAGEATAALLRATYDGEAEVFACRR